MSHESLLLCVAAGVVNATSSSGSSMRMPLVRSPPLRRPTADRARFKVVAARRAVLAAEVDDLQMTAAPLVAREELLQIALGLLDRRPVRQAPARCQSMDVRVDGERRLAERLAHDDARGLVADARKPPEAGDVARPPAAVLVDEHGARAPRSEEHTAALQSP